MIDVKAEVQGNINADAQIKNVVSVGASVNRYDGVADYSVLENKPLINSVELIGNKTLSELGIQPEGDYALASDVPPLFIPNVGSHKIVAWWKATYNGISGLALMYDDGTLDGGVVFCPDYQAIMQYGALFSEDIQMVRDQIPTQYADSPTAGGNATKTNGILFGHIDNGSTATVMTASVEGLNELYDGAMVYLTNGVVTSASGWTLNVNELGAKPVYNSMAASSRITTTFNVAYSMMFVYNSTRVSGGCWDMYYGYNSDNNTLAYNIRRNVSSLKCFTALYRYQICFTKDEEYILPANDVNNKTTTAKALTTEEFDPFGNIYYYSTTTTVSADASVGSAYMWTQYSGVDLRYAFNEGSTLTANRDVYVVCVPQASGKVKLHTDPITQTLPITADGLVYIKLGRAYDTYRIALDNNHPIYQFADGKLKLWVG